MFCKSSQFALIPRKSSIACWPFLRSLRGVHFCFLIAVYRVDKVKYCFDLRWQSPISFLRTIRYQKIPAIQAERENIFIASCFFSFHCQTSAPWHCFNWEKFRYFLTLSPASLLIRRPVKNTKRIRSYSPSSRPAYSTRDGFANKRQHILLCLD